MGKIINLSYALVKAAASKKLKELDRDREGSLLLLKSSFLLKANKKDYCNTSDIGMSCIFGKHWKTMV